MRGLFLRLGLQKDASCVAAYIIPHFLNRNVPSGSFVPLPFLISYPGNFPMPIALPVLPVFSGTIESWHVMKNMPGLFSGNRRSVICLVLHGFLIRKKMCNCKKKKTKPHKCQCVRRLTAKGVTVVCNPPRCMNSFRGKKKKIWVKHQRKRSRKSKVSAGVFDFLK